jgi:hypothetical protein
MEILEIGRWLTRKIDIRCGEVSIVGKMDESIDCSVGGKKDMHATERRLLTSMKQLGMTKDEIRSVRTADCHKDRSCSTLVRLQPPLEL